MCIALRRGGLGMTQQLANDRQTGEPRNSRDGPRIGLLDDAGFDTIKTENLYTFDDTLGFSLAQGE